jgi:hypothetical protein
MHREGKCPGLGIQAYKGVRNIGQQMLMFAGGLQTLGGGAPIKLNTLTLLNPFAKVWKRIREVRLGGCGRGAQDGAFPCRKAWTNTLQCTLNSHMPGLRDVCHDIDSYCSYLLSLWLAHTCRRSAPSLSTTLWVQPTSR